MLNFASGKESSFPNKNNQKQIHIPSRELTYPTLDTLGKGKIIFNMLFLGDM